VDGLYQNLEGRGGSGQLLAKLFPLIKEAGFGSRPLSNEVDVSSDEAPLAQPEIATSDEVAKQKAKKRRVSTPPKGQSCGARITALKEDGFFKEILYLTNQPPEAI
jgi:hypothetical protein